MSQSSSVRIRKATSQDAEALFSVQRASAIAGFSHIFPPEQYPFPDSAESEQWRKLVNADELTVLCAESEGVAVGVAVIGHQELVRFFVVPERWGSGVADVLHEAVLETLRKYGESVCRLWVLEENHRGRRFYERRGWRLDGRTRLGSFPPFPPAVGYTLEVGRREDRFNP